MGRVIMSGIVPLLKAPSPGILAQDIAVGSTVKLMEGGSAVEYLIVNQGIPSNSNLYDASCYGTWLMRKDVHSERQWNSSNVNDYANSTINTWLNGDLFNSFGSVEQAAIKQVKIPYRAGDGSNGSDQSGANGLSCKVFLLGGYEIGLPTNQVGSYLPRDGAKLDYFESGTGDSATSKRIAYLNGSAAFWWLRSPYTRNAGSVWRVYSDGDCGGYYASVSLGIRPALILPSNALFDETTMLLKGVK